MKVFVHKGSWERLQAIGEASGTFQRVDIVVVIGDIDLMAPDPEDRQLWVEIIPLERRGGEGIWERVTKRFLRFFARR